MNKSSFASPVKLADALRHGQMIVLLDDEDRENEGDLIVAAPLIEASHINFMASQARGLICLAIQEDKAKQLELEPMVRDNHSPYTTNFTVSIEARSGVSTGISTQDRARTIQVAVASDAKPDDLVKPGHVFPLIARRGGVLVRAGHTEASCDLVAMAGLEPAAVIVEILNQDGTMARRPELEVFAQKHGLQIGTIADVITHRLANEQTVAHLDKRILNLPQGDFYLHRFTDSISKTMHLALVFGTLDSATPLVRVHQYTGIVDALGLAEEGRWSLQHALAEIVKNGCGVALVLHYPCDSQIELERIFDKKNKHTLLAKSSDTYTNGAYISHGTGAQILRMLGITRMRLLSSRMYFGALAAFGLEISEIVEPPL